MQETITVQYVNAKHDKRHSSIKTQDGRYISVPTSAIGQFQQGQTYTIETELAGPNGQYTNFKGFADAPQQYAPNNGGAGMHAPNQPPPRQAQPKPDTHAEDIFVTGVIGRCFHGTGSLPSAVELEALMRGLRLAWRNSQQNVDLGAETRAPGPQHAPQYPDYDNNQPSPDPNDRIPF